MKNFIQKIKNKFQKQNIEVSNVINPHRHWILLVRSFFVIIVLLILLALFILYKIKNEQIFQVESTNKEPPSLLKDKLLKDVINSFDIKAKKESELKTNPPVYRDPSI